MRSPICKIIYYILKLSVIDYVSPEEEREFFFFHLSFIYICRYRHLSLKLCEKFVHDILKVLSRIDFECGRINFHNQRQHQSFTVFQFIYQCHIKNGHKNFCKS